jgi:hypothetical protein
MMLAAIALLILLAAAVVELSRIPARTLRDAPPNLGNFVALLSREPEARR